ncbi:kinetochore protein Spc24 [Lampetra fluviatilis]
MEKNNQEKHLEVCDDIISFFTSDLKPKENMDMALEMQRNMMENWVVQSEEAIQALKDKNTLKMAREEMMLATNDLGAAKQELEQVNAELQQKLQEREEQRQALARCLAELEEMKNLEKELKLQEEDITVELTDVIPSTKYMVHLMSKLTLVRFDYDADPAIVKGVVGSKTGVQPFELDTRQHSRSFIVNYLWSLVDSVW